MPRDPAILAKEIEEALEISQEEAKLYLDTLGKGKCAPTDAKTGALAKSLAARGMLILDAKGDSYLPVHPRMALSNLFRVYEDKVIRQRKERRLLVDKLTLELIVFMEGESKDKKARVPGGVRKVTG